MWEPAELTFCPVCGDGNVEVDESHDDYYLGELYRCSNRHHFHWQPQEAPVVRVHRTGPPSPLEQMLLDAAPLIAEASSGTSILLEAIARDPIPSSRAAGAKVHIPLIRRTASGPGTP